MEALGIGWSDWKTTCLYVPPSFNGLNGTNAHVIRGYRKIDSLRCISSSPDPNGTKTISPSGSIAGFHSAYIEDTIPSIAQLQPPFALGNCTTYITPQELGQLPFWRLWRLTRNILGPVLLMNNSREALDQAKQVSCNGQRHGDGQRHGGMRNETWADMWKQKNLDGKCIRWKKNAGKFKDIHVEFSGGLAFFSRSTSIWHVFQTCSSSLYWNPQVKPLLHVEVEAWRVFLIVKMQLSHECNEVSKPFVGITLVFYHELHAILIYIYIHKWHEHLYDLSVCVCFCWQWMSAMACGMHLAYIKVQLLRCHGISVWSHRIYTTPRSLT